jgi:short-subunit dehydrogenase
VNYRPAYGVEAFAIPADLSLLGAHQTVLDAVAARGRSVDMLVNNAGYLDRPELRGRAVVASSRTS